MAYTMFPRNRDSRPSSGAVERIRGIIRSQVYESINPSDILRTLKTNPTGTRRDLRVLVLRLLKEGGHLCTVADREAIVSFMLNEILGFGPIEPLLRDESVSEIMVNGHTRVYAERGGTIQDTGITFEDSDHVIRIIDKIVAPLGRRIDESCPMVNGRLPDGSRINAVIPPVALTGPTLTVRKFRPRAFTLEEMMQSGNLSRAMVDFLKAAVLARLNIIVTGGTGSGKTTLLNALSQMIPASERIITIEDAAELKFDQPHVISLEARPANIEGRGAVTIRDLVVNALRMRPDRIVVGEVRAGECLDMLQAMNTGHDGSLTTAHANSPADAAGRMETMALMSGLELPVGSIRQQIVSALDIVVHQTRFADGTRKVTSISEVAGIDSTGNVSVKEIFSLPNGSERLDGSLATGYIPDCMTRLHESGFSRSALLSREGGQ